MSDAIREATIREAYTLSKKDGYITNSPPLTKDILQKYYAKIKVFKSLISGYQIGTKEPLLQLEEPKLEKNNNFMFNFKQCTNSELDELDEKLINENTRDGKIFQLMPIIFALHDYYYESYFEPLLSDVIGLISLQLPLSELDTINRIYVTTQPCGTQFSKDEEYHTGRTEWFIVKN